MTDDPKPTGAPAGVPEVPSPVSRLWDWVKKRREEENRKDAERIRAVGRGVTSAAIESVQTIAEGGAALSRYTGLGEAIEPGYNAAYDEAGGARGLTADVLKPEREARDAFLGRRSDDKIAGFIEDTSQFLSAFVGLGKVRFVTGGARLSAAGWATGAARGAVVDFSATDPYEANLAELAARLEVWGISDVGELLSVQEDDSALVARIKRSAAGFGLGSTIDGIVSGARFLRGARMARKAETKAAGEKLMEEAQEVLRAIDEGRSTTADPITILATRDGEYALVLTDQVPKAVAKTNSGKLVEGENSFEAAVKAYEMGEIPLEAGYRLPDGTVTGDIYDANSRAAGDSPRFTSKAEAEAQRGTMVEALREAERANRPQAQDILSKMEGEFAANGKLSDEFVDDLADNVLSEMDLDTATEVLSQMSEDARIQSVVGRMAQRHSTNLGRRIAVADILLENRPHDPVVLEEAKKRIEQLLEFDDVQNWLVSERARATRLERFRGLQDIREKVTGKKKPKLTPEEPATPRPDITDAEELSRIQALRKAQKEAADTPIAGMKQRSAGKLAVDDANIRQITRLFRLAGGKPKNIDYAIQAILPMKRGGFVRGLVEIFTNALLANPVTAKTIMVSGAGITAFEAAGRALGGVLSGNKALAREGWDIAYGTLAHLKDNFKVARMALNEGRSIINPAPQTQAIGTWAGDVIRVPGHVALAADEFTRVTNYRAFVRAKSLRMGRELNLKGAALDEYVESDLKAAFDAETGIATIPEALEYAERSTLSAPLGSDTFGGKFAALVRETPALQFLSPFIKAATNIYRFTTMHTPLLSRANAEARAIIEAGGEEAAVLQTKQAMAAAVYTTATLMAASGQITGAAPADPALRALWLKKHPEYSVRIGDKWYSYRRTDPFGVMIGLAADYVQFARQMDEADPDIPQLGYALVASLATSVITPTYMKGWGDFINVVDSGDGAEFQRWVEGYAAALVPNTLASFNTDPYLREAQSFMDVIRKKVPGFSLDVDPKYDLFGEPILNGAPAGAWNRSAMFKSFEDGSDSVESEIMNLGQGFAPFPNTWRGINLKDREAFDNGTGVSPWNRMMELVRQPPGGGQSLRERVEELVKSERYQQASGGTFEFPGGLRWKLIAVERERARARALAQVLKEYPKLEKEAEVSTRRRTAAFLSGEAGVSDIEETFGELRQKRDFKSRRLRQR